jgi:hypothetical protein
LDGISYQAFLSSGAPKSILFSLDITATNILQLSNKEMQAERKDVCQLKQIAFLISQTVYIAWFYSNSTRHTVQDGSVFLEQVLDPT